MDFLNKAMIQIGELFRSMTPSARIASGLLLVTVVVSLGYLFGYRTSGPDVYLMNGEQFPASQIPAMEAAFAKAGLGSYQFDGSRVRIPRGQQNAYIAALAENGALPENINLLMEEPLKNTSGPFVDNKTREQAIKIEYRRVGAKRDRE